MDQPLDLTAFAESLHQQICEWSEDLLHAREAPLAADLADLGVPLSVVLEELSDECLAVAIQKKFLVRETFTALFVTRYGPYLARWLFRWGTESHQARDVIQELYVKFYERCLASYSSRENFRAYLHRSAHNLWIQKVCRSRRHAPLDETRGEPSEKPGPPQRLLAKELGEQIDQALEQLRPREQSVLKEIMAGKSADQTAEALGLRKEQVFMTLFRARRHMEQLLELPGKNHTPSRPGALPRAQSQEGDPPNKGLTGPHDKEATYARTTI